MTEIKKLNVTKEEIIKNVKNFNYSYEFSEWSDGDCIIIYQSSFYKITYYFINNICVDIEVESI